MKVFVSFRAWVALLALAGCFDPLYEQPEDPKVYVVCCNAQREVDTCECVPGFACTPSLTACAGGTCMPRGSGSCSGGTGGGAGGGPQDAGTGGAGGSGGSGGAGGSGGSGGAGGSGGGGGGAGGGGGGGGAGPVLTGYEPCCNEQTGRVSTCACYDFLCNAPEFTPCGGGTCAVGTNLSCGP